MKKQLLGLIIVCLAVVIAFPVYAVSDPQDAAGGKDPALFTRMPGFHIQQHEERAFDRFEFPVSPEKKEKVEGRYIFVDYYANDGIEKPSGLQVIRNYVNAAKAIDGELVYEFEDGGTQYAVVRVKKDAAEIWAYVSAADNGMYQLYIIEKKTMSQDVTANAEAMAGNIKAVGKVVI